MKKLLPGIFALFVLGTCSFSQQVSTNINYNTGTAQISLPLGTYETGGYVLPVSLEYTASGIKLAQTASWVGLSWNLNAGGMISREIRNLPDDKNKSYQSATIKGETGWLYWNDYLTTTLWSPLVQNFDFNADDTCQSLCVVAIRGDNDTTIYDTEPDVFSFNVGTISGSFIFKQGASGDQPGERTILLLGDQNYKISYSLNSSTNEIDSFTIIDEAGVQYIFSEKEYVLSNSTTVVTDTIFYQGSSSQGNQRFINDKPLNSAEYEVRTHMIEPDTSEVLTSWHISKIITPLKEEILFSYRDEWIQLDESYFEKYRNIRSYGDNDPIAKVKSNFVDGSFIPRIKTKKLELITCKDFSIDFTAGHTRLDLDTTNISAGYRPKRLDYIKTYVKTGTDSIQKKKYSFYYSYPGSYTTSYRVSNDDVTAFERLQLDSLIISNGSSSLPPYKFTYEGEGYLPSRFSYAQDLWGYYNAAFQPGDTTYVPKVYVYKKLSGSDRFRHYDAVESDSPYDVEYILAGADRQASGYADHSTLEQITYPTGGYVKFEYETNQFVYDNGSDEADLTEYDGPGIRITKKTIGDGINSSNDIVEDYIYEYKSNNDCSGRLIDIPRYGYFDPTAWPVDTTGYDEDYYSDHYIRTNTNLTKFVDGTIFYEEVQIKRTARGKQVITYTDAPSRFSSTSSFTYFDVPVVHTARELEDIFAYPQGTPDMTGIDLTSYAYPFAYNNNYSWNRALVSEIKEYAENDSLIKKTENTYTDYYTNGSTPQQVHGLMIDYLWNNGWEYSTSGDLKNPLILIAKYTINTGVGKRITETKSTTYDPDHWGRYLVTETDFSYNEYGQLSELKTANSDETSSIVKYRYPSDFNYMDTLPGGADDYSKAICKMVYLNMLNSPIETINLLEKPEASAPKRYVLSASLSLPKLQTINSVSIPMTYKALSYNQESPLLETSYTYCDISTSGLLDSIPTAYYTISTINYYNSQGKLLDANIENGNHNAIIYGYDNSRKIAEITNASYYETGYTGFEFDEQSGWSLNENIVTEYQTQPTGGDCRKAVGGDYTAKSTGGSVSRTFTISSMGSNYDEEGGYCASVWVKGSGGGYLEMKIIPDQGTGVTKRDSSAIGNTDWQLLHMQLTKDDFEGCTGTPSSIVISVINYGSSELHIDEVRFHPTDALMKTYSYKPGFGVISKSGPNNIFTYYEYDDLSRLSLVRNHDGDIITYKTYVVNQDLQSNGPNSIYTQNLLVPGFEDIDDLSDLKAGQSFETYEYLDGLARSIQTVNKAYSPNSKDFVNISVYNKYGQQDTLWLPYASDESDGSYKTNATTDIYDFYSESGSKVAYTHFPFAELEYASTPQTRVEQKGSVGTSWQLSQGHTKEYNHTYNIIDTVVWLRYNASNNAVNTESGETYYPANELSYSEVTDENEKVLGVYTNKAGKTIASVRDMGTSSDLWTYFVYDDFGQLVFKISPKAFSQMAAIPSYSFNWTSTVFKDLIYGYKYDEKGRMTERKVPGKDVEYYIYDNLDRPIMFQDGNLRQSDLWKVSKYDVLGRLIATAIETFASTKSQSAMQDDVDTHYSNSSNLNYEVPVDVGASNPHGYTDRTFPASIDDDDFLTINYFDNYNFDASSDVSFSADPDLSLSGYTVCTKGLSTGSKVRVLISSPTTWLLSAVYYDTLQRVVQTISENHLGGFDRHSHKLYFSGWASRSKHTHNDGTNNVIENRYYSYDHSGRMKKMEYKIDEDVSFIMYSNKFNELGQLIEKNLHGEGETETTYWQSVDYKYNIRGWLTNINHGNILNQNSVINFNQYLSATEIVDGLVYDTLSLSITGIDTSRVNLSFDDSKYLLISTPDSAALDRNLQFDEQQSFNMRDRGEDEFDTYYDYAGESFTFMFDSLHISGNWQLADITDSIAAMVCDQLPSQGVTDNTEIEYFEKIVKKFINDRVALVYFNDDSGDLFGMDILYDEGLSALDGDKQYNGLVSGIRWQTRYYDSIQGYGYEYDEAYRLTDANHGFWNDGWDTENRYGLNGITYDNNGNILSLERRGLTAYNGGQPSFSLMDDLTYTYEGNQLNRVDDTRGVSIQGNDFRDNGSFADDEYTYDDNGNLIADDNKQITQITYNHLNLPVQISFGTTHKIVYLYDATGKKLRKTVYYTQDTIKTDYVSNMIYVDDSLEMVMTEEGRMVPLETSGYRAEYFLKDHLGNNRVSFTDTDEDGDADIIQEDHFYPYGMTMGDLSYVSGTKNDFMYQGKEQQDELYLYWYDFGARMFDQQLGRWHVPDPMSQYISPYVGMGNRPSSMIDPDGMWASGGSQVWNRYMEFLDGMAWAASVSEANNAAIASSSAIITGDAAMGYLWAEITGERLSGMRSGGGGDLSEGDNNENPGEPQDEKIEFDLPVDLRLSDQPFMLMLEVLKYCKNEIGIGEDKPLYMEDIFVEGSHLGEVFTIKQTSISTITQSELRIEGVDVTVTLTWDHKILDKMTTYLPVTKPDTDFNGNIVYNMIYHGMKFPGGVGQNATNINIQFRSIGFQHKIANYLNSDNH